MEAKELMIGDLVCYTSKPDGLNEKRESAIVLGTNFRSDVILLWGDGWETWKHESTIEPIPITPEILEKNGFVKSAIEEGVYNFPDNNKALKERGFSLGYHGCGRWFITDHNLMMILYVHQLQQALRLCRLSELADNFQI